MDTLTPKKNCCSIYVTCTQEKPTDKVKLTERNLNYKIKMI